jgi:hypothetical protein
MQAGLARISALPETAAVLKASGAASGPKLSGALMQYDPQSCSLKTAQQSFLEDLTESYQTLPRWGSMRSGSVYPLPELVRPTDATGGGALQGAPTLTVNGNYNRKGASKTSNDGLATWLKKLPTLTKSDGTGGPGCSGREGGDNLRTVLGGPINADWAEWFMGWPIGATARRDGGK